MQTMRAYLFEKGLAKAATGRGRFSAAAHAEIASARKAGVKFSDDAPKTTKPRAIRIPKEKKEKVNTRGVDPKAVREWAGKNGISIGARGRIHTDVIARYLSEVPTDSQESREGEFDAYAPSAPRACPEGTIFVGEYTFGGKTFKHVCNDRAACANSGYSLAVCRCGNHRVVNGHGTGHVTVYPKG